MPKEIEVQIHDINYDDMIRRIKKLGAKLVHKNTRFIRSTYHTCNGQSRQVESFARVRKESNDVTITVKVYNNAKYPDEYEISTPNSFDDARSLMLALNLQEKSIQETYREKWHIPKLPNIKEITFDMVPGLPLYMEIEASDGTSLEDILAKLAINKSQIKTGAFSARYEEYYNIPKTHIENNTPTITFADIHKYVKPAKNAALFKRVIREQRAKLGIKNIGLSQSLGMKTIKSISGTATTKRHSTLKKH